MEWPGGVSRWVWFPVLTKHATYREVCEFWTLEDCAVFYLLWISDPNND